MPRVTAGESLPQRHGDTEAAESSRARRLPWCETEEDYEAVMGDLAAMEGQWC